MRGHARAFIALLFLGCLSTGAAHSAPIDVANYLITTYLPGESPTDPWAPYVFVMNRPLNPGETLTYGDYGVQQAYVAGGGETLAWIDDNPGSRFAHPSRLFLLMDASGIISELNQFPTQLPVLLNAISIWSDVGDVVGPDRFFPAVTFWNLPNSDPPSAKKCAEKFTNAANAASLRLYGNGEESNAGDTKTEINNTLDKSGIPAANRVERNYTASSTPTGDALKNDIRAALREAAAKGSGPEFLLYVSCHGYPGGIALNKNDPNTQISWADFLCMVCQELKNTNKKKVMLVSGACYSGGAIAAMNSLNCPECAGIEIGIAAACAADETGKASGGYFGWHPWDFEEELEDETWCTKDMMTQGQENTVGAAEDIDNPDSQHPEWGKKLFAQVGVDMPEPFGLPLLVSHPNPFNPATTIDYYVPSEGPVRLEIRDLAGRHVATLRTGPRSAGWHATTWQGRDDAGRPVPSGAYSCRLETVDGFAIHRLVLIK
jgi:hypothetical protein